MDRDGTCGSGPCKPFPESSIPSWYRINGTLIGNAVALEIPGSSSCGGITNIWINDHLPGQNDGIKGVIACGSTSKGCCTIRNRIRVRNCKYFYVFEFGRLSRRDAKYCFSEFICKLLSLLIFYTHVDNLKNKIHICVADHALGRAGVI
ncbi:uncharacterized protein LOC132738823 [Ruditapes philippinarum]|uniref:uncharacterized protein LOC132738823 n=1 Tax=Ruditapes philippinarum TaxID=129788 RepID=UPI00295C19B6|nr:uncharacterized protein LOC132738823 [Ruditapes philippinarum]